MASQMPFEKCKDFTQFHGVLSHYENELLPPGITQESSRSSSTAHTPTLEQQQNTDDLNPFIYPYVESNSRSNAIVRNW